MENANKEFQIAPVLCVLAVIVIIGSVIMFCLPPSDANAEQNDPAAIENSVEWLQEHTPRLKELEAQLRPLRDEQVKHEATLKVWNYGFDYVKLAPVKLPLE